MSHFIYEGKKVFYTEQGHGDAVVLLHGNSASSRMFELLLPLYVEDFNVILIDFLGHGYSDRLESFPPDLWTHEARQTIALLEHLGYKKVHLVGTSGGAWVAINTALMRPDLVDAIVADSFDGSTLDDDFSKKLIEERTFAKNDESAKAFYKWCQGDDWESIVEKDTQALLQCAEIKLPLFCRSLSLLASRILLMGSREDEMIRSDAFEEYRCIQKQVENCVIHMFEEGGHPAILSNAEQAARIIVEFLGQTAL